MVNAVRGRGVHSGRGRSTEVRPNRSWQLDGNWMKTTLSHEAHSIEGARAFCRNLARSHYENFFVASAFLPRRLRQHFYNIYAYCRISDDLADESKTPAEALQSLERWDEELHACYQGRSRRAVFVALRETIRAFEIPQDPFRDLLRAFKLDQVKTRYRTYDELLEYCRYSANPVGRLVLYLGGYRDRQRQALSDRTCTALQLANHWQDIGQDLTRLNRIYLPSEDMAKFGYSESDLGSQICDQRFVGLMQMEIGRTRKLFEEGLALPPLVGSDLAMDVELFGRCGLEILRRIESVQYDVFRRRPTLGRWTSLKLLARCWCSRRLVGRTRIGLCH